MPPATPVLTTISGANTLISSDRRTAAFTLPIPHFIRATSLPDISPLKKVICLFSTSLNDVKIFFTKSNSVCKATTIAIFILYSVYFLICCAKILFFVINRIKFFITLQLKHII